MFPYENYRPGQKEAIDFILKSFANGKRIVFLEAPTGAGKSAIAYTVAKHFESSYYLTATKILQSQLAKDFKKDQQLVVLKGRNAYKCTRWQRAVQDKEKIRESLVQELSRPEFNFNCNVGYCKLVKKKSELPECGDKCEYWRQNRRARKAQICVMNFDSFLFQTVYTTAFNGRDFLCADECHNVESKLLDFVSIIISDRDLDIFLEEQKTPEDYVEYIKRIDLRNTVRALIVDAMNKDKLKKADRLTKLLDRLDLLEDVDNQSWVCHYAKKSRSRVIELKPLFVKKYAAPLLFNKADKILMMSATILSAQTMVESLGINKNEVAFHKVPSSFPAKNRPIYFEPCGPLTYKQKHSTYPKLVKAVDAICKKNMEHRGIIHTHNFEIARLLIDQCKSYRRFLFQRDFEDKDAMLAEHGRKQGSIIVAPAMHEGIDLVDDLSRFQIICKVPYANQNDNPQLKQRVELSWNYYVWLTALKLVQSCGRSVRHDKDWASTYILDSGFGKFMDMSINILPEWFLEALQI